MIDPPLPPDPLVQHWLQRHRNPTSFILHMIGIPPTILGVLFVPIYLTLALACRSFFVALGPLRRRVRSPVRRPPARGDRSRRDHLLQAEAGPALRRISAPRPSPRAGSERRPDGQPRRDVDCARTASREVGECHLIAGSVLDRFVESGRCRVGLSRSVASACVGLGHESGSSGVRLGRVGLCLRYHVHCRSASPLGSGRSGSRILV